MYNMYISASRRKRFPLEGGDTLNNGRDIFSTRFYPLLFFRGNSYTNDEIKFRTRSLEFVNKCCLNAVFKCSSIAYKIKSLEDYED